MARLPTASSRCCTAFIVNCPLSDRSVDFPWRLVRGCWCLLASTCACRALFMYKYANCKLGRQSCENAPRVRVTRLGRTSCTLHDGCIGATSLRQARVDAYVDHFNPPPQPDLELAPAALLHALCFLEAGAPPPPSQEARTLRFCCPVRGTGALCSGRCVYHTPHQNRFSASAHAHTRHTHTVHARQIELVPPCPGFCSKEERSHVLRMALQDTTGVSKALVPARGVRGQWHCAAGKGNAPNRTHPHAHVTSQRRRTSVRHAQTHVLAPPTGQGCEAPCGVLR